MSIVCSVELRIQYDLEKTFYFTKTIAASSLLNLRDETKESKKNPLGKM